MPNRRKMAPIGAAALVVALIIGVVVWRAQGGSDGGSEAAGPSPDTIQPGDTTPSSEAPTTTVKPYPADPVGVEPVPPLTREALAWPFAWDSIWNLPLGGSAQRVPAGMTLGRAGVSVDENVLIFEPDAPPVDLLFHEGDWNPNLRRCNEVTDRVLLKGLPVPPSFVTDPDYLGATPNQAAAVLLADGDTLIQTQPMHRCQVGGPLISQYLFAQDSLRNGNGIAGAHGGSQMSSVGGTVRLGELVRGGAIHHALKLNIDCQSFCSFQANDADGKPGFRWPATAADREAPTRYQGQVPSLQMGALLALPAEFDADALLTEPARMVARAMMRYGAYVVDDTHYPIFALTTEWSPNGRVVDEFEQEWGFPMHLGGDLDCADGSAGCAWVQDFARMVAALQVIDNNSPTTIGGGGARLVACAPPYADGTGASACTAT